MTIILIAAIVAAFYIGRTVGQRRASSDRVWDLTVGYVHGCLGHLMRVRGLS